MCPFIQSESFYCKPQIWGGIRQILQKAICEQLAHNSICTSQIDCKVSVVMLVVSHFHSLSLFVVFHSVPHQTTRHLGGRWQTRCHRCGYWEPPVKRTHSMRLTERCSESSKRHSPKTFTYRRYGPISPLPHYSGTSLI